MRQYNAVKEQASDIHIEPGDHSLRIRFRVDGRLLERLRTELPLQARERRALERRLSGEYFWHLGYHGFWQSGRRDEALEAYRRGIALAPWSVRLWKTYALALARS